MRSSSTFNSKSVVRGIGVIALAACGLWMLDRTLAFGMMRCLSQVETGDVSGGMIRAALKHADADIMVFGSSLARYHIDPRTVEEQSGLRCYNVGCDGQNIYYARMLEAMLLKEQVRPRMLWFVLNWSDLYQENLAAAKLFNVYRDDFPEIRQILDGGESTNWIKCLSHAYRFNGRVISLIRHAWRPVNEGIDGFVALRRPYVESEREVARMAAEGAVTEIDAAMIDQAEVKLRIYRDFAAAAVATDIQVVFLYGPTLRKGIPVGKLEAYAMQRFAAIAKEEGAIYLELDEVACPAFQDEVYYCDRRHLNESGAAHWTSTIVESLNEVLSTPPSNR